jgi:hypothetical protein
MVAASVEGIPGGIFITSPHGCEHLNDVARGTPVMKPVMDRFGRVFDQLRRHFNTAHLKGYFLWIGHCTGNVNVGKGIRKPGCRPYIIYRRAPSLLPSTLNPECLPCGAVVVSPTVTEIRFSGKIAAVKSKLFSRLLHQGRHHVRWYSYAAFSFVHLCP